MANQDQLVKYFVDQTMYMAAEKYPNNPELRSPYMAGLLARHLAQAAMVDSLVIDRFRLYVHSQGLTQPVKNYKSSI
jgi:hypothetical protein